MSGNEAKNLGNEDRDRKTDWGALRTLNAEVAERVMGWQWMKRVGQNHAWLFPPNSVDVDTGEEGIFGEPIIVRNHIVGPFETYDGKARKESSSDVPRYSSSIEAAMEVVEQMRAQGWSFACTLYEGHLPYASFCKQTAASSRNAEAETLPEAICRAALKATECLSISNQKARGPASQTD